MRFLPATPDALRAQKPAAAAPPPLRNKKIQKSIIEKFLILMIDNFQ